MWLFISNHIGIHMHLINTVSRAHADNNIIQSSSLIGQSSMRHHQTTTSSHDLCIKSLFVSQWSHQQSINISQLCLRISSLAVHRQQRSQRTKVEHRPWNDASFYFYKDTNDLGSLFWGRRGRGDFSKSHAPVSMPYRSPKTHTHRETDTVRCIHYTMHESLQPIITQRSIPARWS